MTRPELWLSWPESIMELPRKNRIKERKVRERLLERIGKAALINPPRANLSHSRTCVACLVGLDGAGVDLEWTVQRDFRSLADFAYSEQEAKDLNAMNPDERATAFHELWVLKEAAAKCLGLELMAALANCRFSIKNEQIHGSLQESMDFQAMLYEPRPGLRLAWLKPGGGSLEVPACIEWTEGDACSSEKEWRVVASRISR